MTPLPEESILFIFAQVSVLFAGFGGVSTVLGRLKSDIERARLRNVVFTAILLLVMSLFPLLPNLFGAQAETTWRMGNGIFATFCVVFYAASGDLQLFKKANRIDQALMTGDFVLLAFLLASIFGFLPGTGANVYITLLFWHLLSACLMFCMVFAPIWQRDDDQGGV